MDGELILCSTTWKRYDLLNKLIDSAEVSSKKPDRIVIFDNGLGFGHSNPKVEIYRPDKNLGVSAGDNWFFKNLSGCVVVSNDDVELFPYTLEMFWQYKDKGDLLVTAGLPILNAFTLFSINQRVVDTVGYFDESISPNYAYFEDNDFGKRINAAGLIRVDVPTSSFHLGSGTLKALTGNEKNEHGRKFALAEKNYRSKWGGVPPNEKWDYPHNSRDYLYVPYVEHNVTKVK
jgi:GT2 family glycosyltransferase